VRLAALALTALVFTVMTLTASSAALAAPNGNAFGYWRNGPGSRVDPKPWNGLDPAIPEPGGALVFGIGLLTIAGAARRGRHPQAN